MQSDIVTLHRLWRETDSRIESLAKQVREGLAVDEASNFARWLRFSGVIEILRPHEQDVPLPILAKDLEAKMVMLIYECGEWYSVHERSNKPRDAYVSVSKLDALEKQMAAMALAVQKLSAPQVPTENAVRADGTAFHVVRGAA